jgi:hypothetical protein
MWLPPVLCSVAAEQTSTDLRKSPQLSTEARNRFDDVITMRAIEWHDCSKKLTFWRLLINIAVGYLIMLCILTFNHSRR